MAASGPRRGKPLTSLKGCGVQGKGLKKARSTTRFAMLVAAFD